MTLYQLVATGRTWLGAPGTISSRRVFTSPATADAHSADFAAACTAPKSGGDMSYLDPEGLLIRVVELELQTEQVGGIDRVGSDAKPAAGGNDDAQSE
jgi:hypothetical protein